jgi:hypothetical protein
MMQHTDTQVGVSWGARLYIAGPWILILAVVTGLFVGVIVAALNSSSGAVVGVLAVVIVLMPTIFGWWVFWRLLTRSARVTRDGLFVRGVWHTYRVGWDQVTGIISQDTYLAGRFISMSRAKVAFNNGDHNEVVTVAVAWKDGPRAAHLLRLSAPIGHPVRDELPARLQQATSHEAVLARIDPDQVRSGVSSAVIRPRRSVIAGQAVGLAFLGAILGGVAAILLSLGAAVAAAIVLASLIPIAIGLVGVFEQHLTVTDRGLISRNLMRTVCLPWEWIEQFDDVPSGQFSAVGAARLTNGKTVVLGPTADWTTAGAQAHVDELSSWQRRLTYMK